MFILFIFELILGLIIFGILSLFLVYELALFISLLIVGIAFFHIQSSYKEKKKNI